MAQFVVYTDALGDPRALNVEHVKEFFLGELVLSPTERWLALFAMDRNGIQPILRGDRDKLVAALLHAIQFLVDGASVRIYPDGWVERLGTDAK